MEFRNSFFLVNRPWISFCYLLANHAKSTFDKCIIAVSEAELTDSLLATTLKLLKPAGALYVPLASGLDPAKVLSQLKLSGYVSGKAENDTIVGEKPKYEVGASVKLSFGAKQNSETDQKKKAAIWSVNGDDVDDEEKIDPDELLDEEDLAKPDPSSLRGDCLYHKGVDNF